MKQIILLCFLLLNVLTMNAAKKVVIDRIEPADWYVGMKNPMLQLMVYGKDISTVTDVKSDYLGIVIDSLVRLDSPNYLLIYLNLKDAKPGTMTLKLTAKGQKLSVDYQLKAREMSGDKRQGFDISDVRYLLMPD